MSYPIIDIEGIGPKYTKMLKKVGITQTKQLLSRGASKKGRKDLAAESGLKETQILKWSNMADLMRIRGVGEEYSELLEAAGVDTIKEFRSNITVVGEFTCDFDGVRVDGEEISRKGFDHFRQVK